MPRPEDPEFSPQAERRRGARWRRSLLTRLFLVLLPACLAFAVALPSLGLSFLLDDSYDLILARRTSYRDLLLQPLPGFSYYRPLTFVVYKAVYDLWGGTAPWQYHLLAVLLHTGNALLLTLIVRRSAGALAALVSGVLFATFPFAYQALQIVSALPHVLVTSALLAATVCWLRGNSGESVASRRWYAAATLAAAVAPGFHETGAVGGVLLFLLLVLRYSPRDRAFRVAVPWALGACLAGLAYAAAWFWGFDKPGGRAVGWLDRLENSAYWLQAAAYPVTRQLTLVFDAAWLDHHAWAAVVGAAALGLVFATALAVPGRAAPLALAALLLGFLVFLPALLFLPYRDYLEDAPRALYPVAPAVATSWGTTVAASWRWPRGRWLSGGVATCLVAFTLIESIVFLEQRSAMAQWASAAQEAVVAAARSDSGRPLVVVNGPAWLALHRYEFPLGHYGVMAQPTYHGYESLLEARLGRRQPVLSLAVAPQHQQARWTYWPHGQAGTVAEAAALRRAGWQMVWLSAAENGFRFRSDSLP